MPAHHRAEEALEAYLAAAGGLEDAKAPLFQSVDRSGDGDHGVSVERGGTLEHAQRIAGHASPKTTKLYDRTADKDHHAIAARFRVTDKTVAKGDSRPRAQRAWRSAAIRSRRSLVSGHT